MTGGVTDNEVKPSSLDISHLTVREYHPLLHEKMVALFTAGMSDNFVTARDDYTRDSIQRFIQYALPQFDDLDTFLCTKNGGKMFLATTPSDDVVGMFAVLRSDKDVENHEVEFSRISVASSWRRKGVCRLLHDYAVRYSRDKLRARSAHLVTLSSFAPGMRAYSGLGFRKGYDNVLDHRGFDVMSDTPIAAKFWKAL